MEGNKLPRANKIILGALPFDALIVGGIAVYFLREEFIMAATVGVVAFSVAVFASLVFVEEVIQNRDIRIRKAQGASLAVALAVYLFMVFGIGDVRSELTRGDWIAVLGVAGVVGPLAINLLLFGKRNAQG